MTGQRLKPKPSRAQHSTVEQSNSGREKGSIQTMNMNQLKRMVNIFQIIIVSIMFIMINIITADGVQIRD